jgi:PAS domain S-box-containing protein
MLFKKIKGFFPFPKLFRMLIFLSIGLQLIVISQMYFFKPDIFSSPVLVLIRLFRGTVLTFLAGLILAYPYLYLIRYLNVSLPWNSKAVKRFSIQFPLAILVGILITPVILIPAGLIFSMEYDFQILINNSYYLMVLSLFLMVILEAIIYLEEGSVAKIKADNFEKDLIVEAANKAILEVKAQVEEEKTNAALHMIEQEKLLNQNLELEIRKREILVKELDESREQLNSIMSNLVGAAYRCQFDENYTVKYISEKIFDISGYPHSDFRDNAVRSYASIIHPWDIEICRTNIFEASQNKTSYEFEYRIIHRNGDVVWVKENGKCIFDSEGKLLFLDGIIVDITRSKEAEMAVRESYKNYKDLMDFLPQPIFELDLEGNISFSNRAGDDFFGTLPEDPNEKVSALDFFLKEDIPKIIENFRKSAQGIKTEPGEFTAIKKDGTLCPVMVFGSPILRNNKIVGRRGIIIDISERKNYEVSLLNAKNKLEQINNNLEQIVTDRTKELTVTNNELLKVQKENLQSQIEILKQQVNPHFLFNSLNVLSGLITVDVTKAQLFIDEFSQIYRYVLETIEKPVTSLSKEIDFMHSYLFLQQIRYGENLTFSVNIPAGLLGMLVPPLSLQVILENAIKHNIVNESKPLLIEIFSEGQFLVMKNNLQPKISAPVSTGLGLKNLVKRYALITDMEPSFKVETNHYVARIPLIDTENDERD